MPGKQMAIDADLSAGLIDEKQARKRRDEISRQADFYGAMDGSSKFVKGDAIAGLLITAINIIGGIFIGAFQRGLPIGQALSQYTILTVGDGLVTQIPALIISTAAGIMVTHAASGTRMGEMLASQLSAQPRAMTIAGGVLAVFGLVPGLPKIPFLVLGGGLATLGSMAAKAEKRRLVQQAAVDHAAEPAPAASDPMTDLLQIDPIELEVGYALIPLVDEKQGGDLLERISMLRKQSAQELGILVPAIRIRDDIRLPANEYIIKLRGAEIARGEVMPRFLLALDTGRVVSTVEGIDTLDPSFGMPARWISTAKRVEAESLGYVVVEPATVVATHLMEKLKSNASDLLGRQDVQEMVDMLKKTHPALVDDVIPSKINLGVLHRVLQRLLKERVPIRDLVTILEALADAADQTKDPEVLTEHARRALTNTIARTHMDETGMVRGITLGHQARGRAARVVQPARQSEPGDDAHAGQPRRAAPRSRSHGDDARDRRSSDSVAHAAIAPRRCASPRRAGAAESADHLARRTAAVRAVEQRRDVGGAACRVRERETAVLLVTSGKGGVGTSLIAALTALTAAECGKRVLLVDACESGGSLHHLFGVRPTHSLWMLSHPRIQANDALVTIDETLMLLPGGTSGAAVAPTSDDDRRAALGRLASIYSEFDLVLFDGGSRLDTITAISESADPAVLLVTSADRLALAANYALVKSVRTRRSNTVISVVANRQWRGRVGRGL